MSTPADPETAPVPVQPQPIYIGPPLPPLTLPYDFGGYNKISYIRSPEQAKSVLASLHSGPLGFDLEWRPTFVKGAPENPVALIQLANDHSIMLFQVSCMHRFPLELKRVLESPQIVKAGVGIQGDARKLFKDCKISMRNCVDLSLLARTVDNPKWAGRYNSPIGLARLIACYEHKLLVKGKISRSDWTAVLNAKQQEYAGNDAHAGYTLYKKFEEMTTYMPSLPKSTWYSFNIHEGNLCTDDQRLWEPENPGYDPGPLPDPKPPTEAQLLRKRKKAEDRAAREASSIHVEEVDFGVSPPLFPNSRGQLPATHAVGGLIPSLQAPTSAGTAPGFTMKQVGPYHYSSGKQTTARNISQDRRSQSTSTNKSGPVSHHPQNTLGVPQTRQFSSTSKRPKQDWKLRSGHVSNRRTSVGTSVDTRDNPNP